ncbi:hypothetical protein ACFQ60_15450 [Streptomyces zhihengii]
MAADVASPTEPPAGATSAALRRCAAVFLPGALPRDGRIAFWDPEGGEVPGADGRITVVRPHGTGVRSRSVPARTLPVAEAAPSSPGPAGIPPPTRPRPAGAPRCSTPSTSPPAEGCSPA